MTSIFAFVAFGANPVVAVLAFVEIKALLIEEFQGTPPALNASAFAMILKLPVVALEPHLAFWTQNVRTDCARVIVRFNFQTTELVLVVPVIIKISFEIRD